MVFDEIVVSGKVSSRLNEAGTMNLALLTLSLLSFACSVEAEASTHVQLSLGVRSAEYETPCHQNKYFMVDATQPCMDLQINVTQIAGEPNLYVSKGVNKYPSLRNLAWSSYNWGNESMVISSADPDYHTGTFYIGVHAYCGSDVITGNTSARYTVVVSQIPRSIPDDIYDRQVSGQLQADKYKPFRFCAPKQCVNISITLEHCMSYNQPGCNNRYGFPELLISKTLPQPQTSDMAWMLAESSRRTILLSPSDPNFEPGHYYMSVYGWCTPDNKCPDPKTCGPCNLIANLAFNVTVSPVDVDAASCSKMMKGRPKPGSCTTGGAVTISLGRFHMLLLAAGIFMIQFTFNC